MSKLPPERCPHCHEIVHEHIWECGCEIVPFTPAKGEPGFVIKPCGAIANVTPATIREHLGDGVVVEEMLAGWERNRA